MLVLGESWGYWIRSELCQTVRRAAFRTVWIQVHATGLGEGRGRGTNRPRFGSTEDCGILPNWSECRRVNQASRGPAKNDDARSLDRAFVLTAGDAIRTRDFHVGNVTLYH
jgi:hypothetical protein